MSIINKKIGYLVKRNYDFKVKVRDLLQELEYLYFELNIIKQTIQAIQHNDLSCFDSSVGDWKCQTRTTMIIDIINNHESLHQELSEELLKIEKLLFTNRTLFQEVQQLSHVQLQNLTIQLQEKSLIAYLTERVDYHTPDHLIFLSLCYLTTIQNNQLSLCTKHNISTNKMKAIINSSKVILCHLSIQYEQAIAKKHSTIHEQSLLQQVETKEIQHMTALLPSFKSIFKKMILTQQPLIIRQTFFCNCGKVQSIQNNFYAVKNNNFQETNLPNTKDQAITTIEAYQFSGSLEQLQDLLLIPHTAQGIPKEYYQPCQCLHPTPKNSIQSIDEAIMAFFAQHPQFTNHQPIDFARFGLLDSDLKKEYDHLLTLPGFSRHDMSIFQIIHMYPSTVADVVAETNRINDSMKRQNICSTVQPSITIRPQIT